MTESARSDPRRQDTWTVLRIIRWTTGFLEQKGVDTPRLDAEVLLADLLAMNRVELYLNFDRPLNPDELAGFRERVRRRAGREPAAYITGQREFFSINLAVTPDVLIPRPETELLVEEAVRLCRPVIERGEDPLIADIGTGSGAIAIALAGELPQASIWAVDISEAALALARSNADRNGLAERVRFYAGDLIEALPETDGPFHVIVSNPPYVPTAAFADMEPEVRDHEPRLALWGGDDGLEVIRRLLPAALGRLVEGGALAVEIWHEHGPALTELARENGYHGCRIIPDLAGRDRVAILEKS